MARSINFKGFKQVTAEEYANTPDRDKKGYLWLVRYFNDEDECISSSIYFGTRLYSDSNDLLAALMKIGGDDIN